MKKKSFIKTALLAVIGISLLATCAEADTMFSQILWSGSCLTICSTAAAILKLVEKKEESSC